MRNAAMVGDISAQERLMVICGEEAALRKAASEILEKIQQDAHLEDRQTARQTMG